MNQKHQRKIRSIQVDPLSSAMLDYIGTMQAEAAVETRALPESRPVELRLALLDFGLLLLNATLMIGFVKLLDPLSMLHDGLMLSLNLTLGCWFSFMCRYLDLSDGRYSLGKALLMGLSLWMINASVVWFTASDIPLASIAVLTAGYGLTALISGWCHYEASRPFMMKKTDSPYFRLERAIKRGFDLTASVLGLLCISPVMILVPILLCLESKGSPIFTQTRIGEHEAEFLMFKFRSMIPNSDSLSVEKKTVLFKRDDDPRVTRLGRIIRKLSIDELPQLFNVVRGEMSLVGPRPPLPSEYELMNWYHRRKFEAPPGMTGLWQIIGRAKNQRDFNSVAAYDVYYVENWCLMEDVLILLKTIPVVLLQKGAC